MSDDLTSKMAELGFSAYEVGKPFVPGKDHWPDCSQLRLSPDGCDLSIFFTRPAAAELHSFHHGTAEAAWIDTDHIGMLCFRMGMGIPWQEAAFQPGRQTAIKPGLPPGGGHLLLSAFLVEAESGILQGIRMFTLPPSFVQVMTKSVNRMLRMPHNDRAAGGALESLWKRYPTTEDLVNRRATARCVAGGPELVEGPREDA